MLIITTIPVTPFQQNTRILTDTDTAKACIIDPGGEIDRILEQVDLSIITIESIYCTHCHIDHVGGVQALQDRLNQFKCPKPTLYYHTLDAPLGAYIKPYAQMSGLNPDDYNNAPPQDIDTATITTFRFGKYVFENRFTPGHSPGHTVLYLPKTDIQLDGNPLTAPLLIAGDTLFRNSIGRTDLPGGDHATLIHSIRTQLLSLPPQTIVCPGHGPNTTIGDEAAHNPFLI